MATRKQAAKKKASKKKPTKKIPAPPASAAAGADADRVRLGAHLAPGTTVMHEGFVNFNAGTLGHSMVEGRISAGVIAVDTCAWLARTCDTTPAENAR